jgi:hypothetical protein
MFLAMEHVSRFIVLQANGTARPSLALENLQETEKLKGIEREYAEEVVTGALGSMYSGE